jgi:hypothetical protein
MASSRKVAMTLWPAWATVPPKAASASALMLPSVLSVCQKPGGMNAATTIEAMIAGAEAPLSRAP